jgi:transcription factor AP-4
LQQTAEYIDRLELEKQQLAGQNQHLQRLVDSLGGGNNNNNNECPQQIIQQTLTSPSTGGTAIKKRKLDQVMTVQTISDSSDEGLGSMSPEPVSQMIFSNGASAVAKTHMVSATSVSTINVKDYVNLQNQMETERRHRIQLEEQLKQLEMQFYSSHQPAQKYHQIQSHEESDEVDGQQQQQQQQQVETIVEEKIILRQAGHEDIHYIGTVPHHQQFVVVSTSSPGTSPKHVIINDDDDNSRTLSSDELHKDELKMVRQKMSPKHHHHHHREIRIPSILEQAIKAEPKVEVERINSPCLQINMIEETAVQSPPRPNSPSHIRTTYPNNNTRPNLEAIVEAIRHLEGDAFDMDDAQETKQSPNSAAQEVPLALTTGNKYQNCGKDNQQPFLKFRQTSTSQSGLPTFSLSVPSSQQQQQYQQRPGVIVVKQSS